MKSSIQNVKLYKKHEVCAVYITWIEKLSEIWLLSKFLTKIHDYHS